MKLENAARIVERAANGDLEAVVPLLEAAKWALARVAALETAAPAWGALAPQPGDDGKGFWIRTEHSGRCPVELRHGCGSSPQGVSVRFNGICVAHFIESGSENVPSAGWLSLFDVYPSNGRIAGLNWVDVHDGHIPRGAPTKWVDLLRRLADGKHSARSRRVESESLRRIANYLESLGDHE